MDNLFPNITNYCCDGLDFPIFCYNFEFTEDKYYDLENINANDTKKIALYFINDLLENVCSPFTSSKPAVINEILKFNNLINKVYERYYLFIIKYKKRRNDINYLEPNDFYLLLNNILN